MSSNLSSQEIRHLIANFSGIEGERLAKLEGERKHLATRDEVQSVRTELKDSESKLTWRIVLAIGIAFTITQALGLGGVLYFCQ